MELKRISAEGQVEDSDPVNRGHDYYPLKDPNSPSRNPSSTPPASCCVRLCCKSMTYREDERPGLVHYSDTQPYWCNITMDPCGPDRRLVNPKVCQPGRECFVGEE